MLSVLASVSRSQPLSSKNAYKGLRAGCRECHREGQSYHSTMKPCASSSHLLMNEGSIILQVMQVPYKLHSQHGHLMWSAPRKLTDDATKTGVVMLHSLLSAKSDMPTATKQVVCSTSVTVSQPVRVVWIGTAVLGTPSQKERLQTECCA